MPLFLILILLLTYNAESKKRPRLLYFLSVKYEKNTKFLNNFEVTINKKNTSINILMDVSEDLDNLWSTAKIFIWLKAMNDYKQIVSYDVNLCQHLERLKSNKDSIVTVWVMNFLKYGNISKSCPIVKDLYYVSNFKPDKDSIPPFTPAGLCRLKASIYKSLNYIKEVIGSVEFEIELK